MIHFRCMNTHSWVKGFNLICVRVEATYSEKKNFCFYTLSGATSIQ